MARLVGQPSTKPKTLGWNSGKNKNGKLSVPRRDNTGRLLGVPIIQCPLALAFVNLRGLISGIGPYVKNERTIASGFQKI